MFSVPSGAGELEIPRRAPGCKLGPRGRGKLMHNRVPVVPSLEGRIERCAELRGVNLETLPICALIPAAVVVLGVLALAVVGGAQGRGSPVVGFLGMAERPPAVIRKAYLAMCGLDPAADHPAHGARDAGEVLDPSEIGLVPDPRLPLA